MINRTLNKEFLINLFILLSINLLIKPLFIFGVDLKVQNAVGVEAYGFYFALLSLTYLLQMLNDFGIPNFNSKEIAQKNELLSQYLPNILGLKLILASVYFVFTFVVGYVLGYPTSYFYLLFWLAINQVLVSFIQYLRTNIAAFGYYRRDSFLSALDRFLSIIFCSFLLYKGFFQKNEGIEYFVYAQTLALFLTFILAFCLVFRQIPSFEWKLDWFFLKEMLYKSYPYALIVLLMTFYTRSDSVLLERLLPDGKIQTGIYASAYRLLDALNSIGLLFGGLLLPMFSKIIASQEANAKQELQKLTELSLGIILVGGISVALFIFAFSHEITQFLYHQVTDEWAKVLRILILSFIPICFMYIAGALLTANDNIWEMIRIFSIAALVNIFLNFIFIQNFKAEGAALATLITQCLVAFMLAYQMYRVELGVTKRLVLGLLGFVLLLIFLLKYLDTWH